MNLEELVNNPQESLALELKDWIDPDTNLGKAKIIKACIAMRNNNGGYILIGFDNNNGQPSDYSFQEDVKKKFHIDKIQGFVSKYASEQFEIKIDYPKINNLEVAVITVPPGIKTPVASKSILEDQDKKALIKLNMVYVRSLNSNNTPSTTEATYKDWQGLIEKCVDNREADIGSFIQRHLTKQNMKELSLLLGEAQNIQQNSELEKREMENFVADCENRYKSVLEERIKTDLPSYGLREIGVIIKGSGGQHKTNEMFLNLIDSANPRYTGWPAWLRLRNNEEAKPYVKDDAWESFIISKTACHITFWRIYSSGQFFLLNVLQDDISNSTRAPKPFDVLDFGLVILRAGEEIMVALLFAKAMGYDPEQTTVKFGFKWTGLKDRNLCSWADGFPIDFGKTAHQDTFYTEIEIPLNASNAFISRKLYESINLLFNLFDGFEIQYKAVEDLFNKLVNRKL